MQIIITKNHVSHIIPFDTLDHARLIIEELTRNKRIKVIDDDTLATNTLTLTSSHMREIMLTVVDMAVTLPSSYRPHIDPLLKRASPTEEQRTQRKKDKAKRGAYVTASDIAKQLGRTPRDIRQALRKLKLVKPAHGWAWPPHEAATIKARLSKQMIKSVEKPAPMPLQVH